MGEEERGRGIEERRGELLGWDGMVHIDQTYLFGVWGALTLTLTQPCQILISPLELAEWSRTGDDIT